MKNNQYLEKYGEKALELLTKKSFKQTVPLELYVPQDNEHQLDSLKVGAKPQKSCSHKSLPRSSKSKSKLAVNQLENQYTFQKPLNLHCAQEKQKNRKKLLISGLSTPKNNRSARMTSGIEQRIQSSSTKKKAADLRISQKLNEAIHKHKTTKSIVKQLLECLDLISQHECKITKWVGQFKEVVYHIADQATYYRKKLKEQMIKTKKMQKDMDEVQASFKATFDKKRKPVEVLMIEENQKLRQKIGKLQQKLENFERKQMVLIETIEKLRCNPKQTDTTTSLKKQENTMNGKIKQQFYGHLDEDEEDESQNEQQEKQ